MGTTAYMDKTSCKCIKAKSYKHFTEVCVPAAMPWSEDEQQAIRKTTQSTMEKILKLGTAVCQDEVGFKKGIWQ